MVGPKRNGQGDEAELTERPVDVPIMAAGALAAAAQRAEKKDEEKLSIFWRVFGGTILSIAALVCLTVFNNVSGTLSDLRAEVVKANETRSAAISELRAEMAKAQEARADLIRKDEFNTRMTGNWDRIQALQQQNNGQNATLTSMKTELDGIKERLTRQTTDLDAMRKDQAATSETIKRDIAALDGVKERLTGVAADLKASRDDLAKLRGEMDKNSAYDHERRDRRDVQYKQIDETLKELSKGMQDCREKMARLEGQYGPPAQPAAPAPKKTAGPRVATPPAKSPDPMSDDESK